MTVLQEHQVPDGLRESGDSADNPCQELIAEINREIIRLQRFSTRGILALALFLGVSFLAWWGFPLLPVSETVTALLGKPPSARIISIALLIYTFSALILSLARMSSGIEHRSSFSHVGFLTSFFLFYYFGRALQENYWAVFGAGITILGVESYRIWSFCSEAILKKQEDSAYVTRTGRPPLEE
jgi:hypothetical protein